MAMDRRAYQEAVSEAKKVFGDFVHLVSIESRPNGVVGGVLSEVTRDIAAKLTVDGSHRQATTDEVRVFVEKEALKAIAIAAEDAALRARQANIVVVGAQSPAPVAQIGTDPPDNKKK